MLQLRSASRTTLTRIVGTFFATVLSATAAFAQATPHGGQFQVIREQAGTFADSIKLWSEA